MQAPNLLKSPIYLAIKENKKSMQEIAALLGNMHRTTLSRKLANDSISIAEVRAIADGLGIDRTVLFLQIAK